MRSVLVLLAVIAYVQAVSFNEVIKEEWQAFKLEHRKRYNDDMEERFRLKIFNENRHIIAKHNQLYASGKKTYKLSVNKYADMLQTEFKDTMNGYNHTLRELLRSSDDEYIDATFISPAHVTIPKDVDWRTKDAVTPVKDQGQCGSCWAFSTTGSLEGQHFRKTGVLISLSEQNLVDCSRTYGNMGCMGGVIDNSFKYIRDNGGIDTEKAYPYKAIDDYCHYDPSSVGASDRGFVDIPKGDEEKLRQAVATIGPISVAIDASQRSFQFYSKGVYDEPACSSWKLDHAVLVVGYGTDLNGQDYWLVKNSWGTTWGDRGYIKMARNKQNQCGIATASSYPLV